MSSKRKKPRYKGPKRTAIQVSKVELELIIAGLDIVQPDDEAHRIVAQWLANDLRNKYGRVKWTTPQTGTR